MLRATVLTSGTKLDGGNAVGAEGLSSYGNGVTPKNGTRTQPLGPKTTGGTMRQTDYATRSTTPVLR